MKRKLDADNIPVPNANALARKSKAGFTSYGLDARLLQAVEKQGFFTPTAVQAQAIPLALAGKDILARSKTGSGKTAAYILPILQSILRKKSETDGESRISALILVPTRELAEQVLKVVTSSTVYCAQDVRAVNLTRKVSDVVERSMLADSPDVVVGTPARASAHVASGALSLDQLAHLVIDEADLVLSYGYGDDLRTIAGVIPKGIQTFLMSATLTAEVDTVKTLFCRDPALVQLDEKEDSEGQLKQFIIRCGEDEKFLLIFVIFKLKLIRGKCIIFVGDIDRCYRLKLYLEQFGIKACVLNSELPLNSRLHVVEEFNKNIYEIIIATDEQEVLPSGSDGRRLERHGPLAESGQISKETEGENGGSKPSVDDKGDQLDDSNKKQPMPAKTRRNRRDKDFGVSRGIDFKNVACVLNFDLPTSPTSYTHRIGRTARAGNAGMALSFVVPRGLHRKHKPTCFSEAKYDEIVLEQIVQDQKGKGKEVVPYQFDMKQVVAFRYRMEDALRAVTRLAVREARTREIRQELLKSEKLRRHFEENPKDLQHLRHDNESRAARVQSHLKHIPDYLLPQQTPDGHGLVGTGRTGEEVTLEDLAKVAGSEADGTIRNPKRARASGGKGDDRRDRSRRGRPSASTSHQRRKIDPLKNFKPKSSR